MKRIAPITKNEYIEEAHFEDLRDLIEIEFDDEVKAYFQQENQRMKNGFTPDLNKTVQGFQHFRPA